MDQIQLGAMLLVRTKSGPRELRLERVVNTTEGLKLQCSNGQLVVLVSPDDVYGDIDVEQA